MTSPKRSKRFWWGKLSVILFFVAFFFHFIYPVRAAKNYDLSSSTNYNIRIDGPTADDWFSLLNLRLADLDNDNKKDIIVSAIKSDNNSRNNSGSVYVIYHALLEELSETSNNIDLANSNNYNLRFDGPSPNVWLADGGLTTGDFDNDGKEDILIACGGCDYNSKTNSGSVYVIFNSLLDDYSGTGNNIDLADTNNFNLRIDGPAANELIGYRSTLILVDINSNGRRDLLLGASAADKNARINSGSLYVIYDNILDDYIGVGNNMDLSNAAFYNLRYDGPTTGVMCDLNNYYPAGDFDFDGKLDILIGCAGTSNNSRTQSGSLFVIYDDLIDDYSGTGNNIDLSNSANYNLRYDGAGTKDYLCDYGQNSADLNNNGKQDILIPSHSSDNNSRTDSGSLYIIYDSLIDDYSGTGNNIDLANSANYNLRYDGAVASELLADITLSTMDYDNDGRQDILVGAPDLYIEPQNGRIYVINNNLIDDYSGTGNNIDMANSTNYSFKFTGPNHGHLNLSLNEDIVDFNNDGSLDFIFSSHEASPYSRNEAGSLYIIYNYPHSWDLDSVSDYLPGAPSNITGRISATGSTTNIYNVQYSLDGSAFYGTWNECPNDGGSYDSTDTEKFKCPITAILTEGLHKFYLRSSDVNASYTARHKVVDLRIDKTPPAVALTQVEAKPFKNQMNLSDYQPTLFGKITDSLSNDIVSGPDYLETELQKKDSSGGWQTIESKRINLTENYWTSNNSKITDNTLNTSNKYSTFSYTPSTKLSTGSYQLEVTGVDKADNHSSPASFQFTLGVNQAQKTPPQPTSEPQPNQPEAETTPIPVFQLGSKTFVKFFPLFLKISLLLSVLALAALTMIKKFR